MQRTVISNFYELLLATELQHICSSHRYQRNTCWKHLNVYIIQLCMMTTTAADVQ